MIRLQPCEKIAEATALRLGLHAMLSEVTGADVVAVAQGVENGEAVYVLRFTGWERPKDNGWQLIAVPDRAECRIFVECALLANYVQGGGLHHHSEAMPRLSEFRVSGREVEPCPQSGQGVHAWLMRAAWSCRISGKSAHETVSTLEGMMTRRPDPPNEIEAAVSKVFSESVIVGDRSRGWAPPPPKWPEPSRERIERAAASGLGVVDLWEASPLRADDNMPDTGELLGLLFPGDPLLCVGGKSQFFTARLSVFASASASFEQITPCTRTAKVGLTADGRQSQHAKSACGPRKFLVVEGDKLDGEPIPKDWQAAVLLYLAGKAPLTLAVDSGGKSLHGWFYCADTPDPTLRGFFLEAVTLGADPKLWCPNQFCRMPGGTRNNGKPQTVLFFNPSTLRGS